VIGLIRIELAPVLTTIGHR